MKGEDVHEWLDRQRIRGRDAPYPKRKIPPATVNNGLHHNKHAEECNISQPIQSELAVGRNRESCYQRRRDNHHCSYLQQGELFSNKFCCGALKSQIKDRTLNTTRKMQTQPIRPGEATGYRPSSRRIERTTGARPHPIS